MGTKAPSAPVWWKNTFFLFGFVLVLLALLGLIRGEGVIRDPGQKFETGLVLFYFVGGVAMLINGWLTHQQGQQVYDEYVDEHGATKAVEKINAEAGVPNAGTENLEEK